MKLSKFGQRITKTSGISELMDDLGNALSGGREMLMLGGGNPARIPAVEKRFRESMEHLLETEDAFERAIGYYDTPQGNRAFIEALAALLREECGWDVGPENIALTNGSQSAFFILFNMFAGECEDGKRRKVLLPLAPEYIGYADVGLTPDFFVSRKPEIEFIDDCFFKYHVDSDALESAEDIGAICVSRPTNPTGNVLTDVEMKSLSDLALSMDVPFIVDNAYGTPFPNIIFTDAHPIWNENTIVCMSLSKLGLPAARTGIVIARKEVVQSVSEMNAVMGLAPTGLGATIATDLVKTGEVIALSREVIRPYYQEKASHAVSLLRKSLTGLPHQIHKPEGALFLWLWLPGLSVSSRELYERLKKRGVLVVSGHYFYPGLSEEWAHKDECIRITYSQDESVVAKGVEIIGEEVRTAFS